ncbi:hypothetical protein EA127_27710 [Salmonella enterica subsp. diarizonae serovar 48:i:z]|nr:hypothetical protein [Salmonella enterica subsp. diarizonae serovar 48:i:z]
MPDEGARNAGRLCPGIFLSTTQAFRQCRQRQKPDTDRRRRKDLATVLIDSEKSVHHENQKNTAYTEQDPVSVTVQNSFLWNDSAVQWAFA